METIWLSRDGIVSNEKFHNFFRPHLNEGQRMVVEVFDTDPNLIRIEIRMMNCRDELYDQSYNIDLLLDKTNITLDVTCVLEGQWQTFIKIRGVSDQHRVQLRWSEEGTLLLLVCPPFGHFRKKKKLTWQERRHMKDRTLPIRKRKRDKTEEEDKPPSGWSCVTVPRQRSKEILNSSAYDVGEVSLPLKKPFRGIIPILALNITSAGFGIHRCASILYKQLTEVLFSQHGLEISGLLVRVISDSKHLASECPFIMNIDQLLRFICQKSSINLCADEFKALPFHATFVNLMANFGTNLMIMGSNFGAVELGSEGLFKTKAEKGSVNSEIERVNGQATAQNQRVISDSKHLVKECPFMVNIDQLKRFVCQKSSVKLPAGELPFHATFGKLDDYGLILWHN